MAKNPPAADAAKTEPTVGELKAALEKANAEKEALAKKLEAAQTKKADKGPDGIKMIKPAPDGNAGSDGKGNLIKHVNERYVDELEAAGWKVA